jgi:hypothetical protein
MACVIMRPQRICTYIYVIGAASINDCYCMNGYTSTTGYAPCTIITTVSSSSSSSVSCVGSSGTGGEVIIGSGGSTSGNQQAQTTGTSGGVSSSSSSSVLSQSAIIGIVVGGVAAAIVIVVCVSTALKGGKPFAKHLKGVTKSSDLPLVDMVNNHSRSTSHQYVYTPSSFHW